MPVSQILFTFGLVVDVCERQIYFDQFLAVFLHGVNSHG